MLRLTKGRRELLAEKLADLANFAVAVLVFGQAVGDDAFSPWLAIGGIAIWVVFVGVAYALSGGAR